MKKETRDVSGFDKILVREFGEVRIIQGDTEKLTIEADDEVIQKIKTEVIDGCLHLGVGRQWMEKIFEAISAGIASQPIKFVITVKSLSELAVRGAALVKAEDIKSDNLSLILKGAGKMQIDGLEVGNLVVSFPGAGEIALTGKAAVQEVSLSGVGSYNAAGLQSRRCKVVLNGMGKATVWVEEELDASCRGLGVIEYRGNPEVKKNISGFGSVKSIGMER